MLKQDLRLLMRELKEQRRRPIQIFFVQTTAGKVVDVPVTAWKELVPYWHNICRAILEVLTEGDFKPYPATMKRPDGFVASYSYWKLSSKSPKLISLSEARFFIYKLLEKPYFTDSIKEFNKKIQKNWLAEKNIAILGGYVYSFYYTLKPILKIVGKGSEASIKPTIEKNN
jgi:hypothetical protein